MNDALNDSSTQSSKQRWAEPSGNEEEMLDSALQASDELLIVSLRRDETRRRRRQLVLFTLLLGGIGMATTCMAVLAGWLTLATTAAERERAAAKELQQLVPGPIVDTRPITKDCMALAYMPDWNHGEVDNVAIANNEGGVRAFWGWDPIPGDLLSKPGRRVYLAVYSRETTAAPTGGQIAVQRLTEDWPEQSSWQTQPKANGAADKVVTEFQKGDGWKLFDVTPLVVDRNGPRGVVARFADETRSSLPGHWSGYAFVSREGEGQWKDKHPRLLIVDALAPAPAATENTGAWVERLKGLRDHMHTAFGVGPDLTLLEPQEGLEIVRAAWPQIERYEVKTGLLKTFAFSKALPQKHPKVLQVLHLGMTDPDARVRDYAASYLEEYSAIDFKLHPERYAAWYEEHGDKPPHELLRTVEESDPASGTPRGEAALAQLNAQGWQQFFAGDYRASEEAFRDILAADAEHLAAMNGLGFSLLNQGQVAEAESYFDKYLAVEPDAPGPLNGKARCLMAGGKLDEAIEVWVRARQLAPKPNDVSANLARAYMKRGDDAKAIPLLEEWLQQAPDRAEFRELLETARKNAAQQNSQRDPQD